MILILIKNRVGTFLLFLVFLCSSSRANAALGVNDNFADATELIGSSVTVNGSNGDATAEVGEPSRSGTVNSLWYTWTAPYYDTDITHHFTYSRRAV